MTTEALTFLFAIGVPLVALLAVVGLVAGVKELERNREELIDLGAAKR